jgi:hypothetical protein
MDAIRDRDPLETRIGMAADACEETAADLYMPRRH